MALAPAGLVVVQNVTVGSILHPWNGTPFEVVAVDTSNGYYAFKGADVYTDYGYGPFMPGMRVWVEINTV